MLHTIPCLKEGEYITLDTPRHVCNDACMEHITLTRPSITKYAAHLTQHGRITPAVQEALDKAVAVRRDYKVVFYIAGGLTGVDEATKQRYVATSELITTLSTPEQTLFGYAPHVHGTDPVQHPHVTPEEVRDIDYLWAVVVPDAHINFWTPAAHGNAVEAGWAELHAIPSVYLVPKGVVLSRLVRGMHNIAHTITYTNFAQDGHEQLRSYLHKTHAAQTRQPVIA